MEISIRAWCALAAAVLAIVLAGCGGGSPGVDSSLFDASAGDDDSSGTDGDADNDADGDADSDTSSDCGEADVNFEVQTPTVVLLVDQSGSMDTAFGDGTRWTVVRDALLDENDGIVMELQSVVRFGLTLYTSNNGYAGGECPLLDTVEPAFDNYGPIASVFENASPESDTPTGESIVAVTASLVADSFVGPKVIVLATDGEPDTCEVPNPQQGQAESVAAAEAAFDQGVRLFVISVGDEVGLDHLQDMANAGAGVEDGDPDAPYYQALDQAALVEAFETIIYGTRDCTLELEGEVVDGMAAECVVTVDGEEVPYNDPDGWALVSPSEIELLGETCEAIQHGDVSIEVHCPCGSYLPPE